MELFLSSGGSGSPLSNVFFVCSRRICLYVCLSVCCLPVLSVRARPQATKNKDKLAALMVTYPSTYGVFEEGIKEICQITHDNGGLVSSLPQSTKPVLYFRLHERPPAS